MAPPPEEYPVSRPVYGQPPVVETLLGVQFKPLARFRSLHYGIFWRDYLDDLGWESTNVDEPLLERYAESFDNAQLKKNQRLDAEEEVIGVRVRFKNKNGSRSIQFQPDKLYFSWLRTDEEAGQRPHYSELKAEFAKLFRTLIDFANQYELGPIHPDLWEVKYLNQIPSGPLWGEPEEWHRVLPNLFHPAVSPVDVLRFATFQGEWYYEIKPKLGRISVRAAKMLVSQKPPPVLYLRFLARGEIGESGVADWSRGFDIGHGACNQLFNAVTSPEAQKEWDIRNGS